MNPTDFISEYEKALGTQNWEKVGPLIDDNATVTFSTGAVHKGKKAVREAFEKNFQLIKSEEYTMKNIHWVYQSAELAVYVFEYEWQGIYNGQRIGGKGVGTSVLKNNNTQWQLLSEHLGKA